MSKTANLLFVTKDNSLHDRLQATLLLSGMSLSRSTNCTEAFLELGTRSPDLLVLDISLGCQEVCGLVRNVRMLKPALPMLLASDYDQVPDAVEAIRCGANDYVLKPFEAGPLTELVNTLLSAARPQHALISADPLTRQVAELAKRVAESAATVMISGESGTGKEVFARYIHECSPRASRPFVAINCAAIPADMLESILFGHEKGAFTGAHTSKAGKFEQANSGTLLLDEISEMDLGLQAKLLRVLQEREVERLGGSKPVPLDVRIIATTNRNLKQEVCEGRFREDLFYRLNVFPLHLPTLNQRRDDIVPLARRFVELYQPGSDYQLDETAARVLEAHHWQGNVRELENVVQRALILANGKTICSSSILFEESLAPEQSRGSAPVRDARNLDNDLKSLEKEIIISTIGNSTRKDAAAKLGISQRTLRYKLARFRKDGIAIPA
jgi:two-component system, response regulator FlrC